MDKRAENTFVAGLNTDRHPLTSQKTELIDAQNIDLVAIGEGYQLILQKREGNIELLLLPPVWNSLYTYLADEYATESGDTYKALSTTTNELPSTNPTVWDIQATPYVSAGLRPGYIPLALKEFNNVAYIISVDPTTYTGEIGTFPSPDYSQFIYVQGANPVSTPSIGTPIWDPRANPPDFEFGVVSILHSGDDEVVSPVSLTAKITLSKGGFRINNTGLLPDTYTLTRSLVNANVVTKVSGVAYTYGVDTISIFPGAHRDITFEIQHPFIATYDAVDTYDTGTYATDGTDLYISIQTLNTGHTPSSSPLWWTSLGVITDYVVNSLVDTTITITSSGLPATPETYNFKYHITPTLAARYQTETNYFFGSIGDTTAFHRVAKTGGSVVYEWISNDATMAGSIPVLVTLPATVGNNAFAAVHQVSINFVSNPIPQVCRTVLFYMTGTFSASGTETGGTTTLDMYAEQYAM